MTITRRDWWIGITAIVLALFASRLLPRYEWQMPSEQVQYYEARQNQAPTVIRLDKWTGRSEIMYARSR